MRKNFVTINGTIYDRVSGLPVRATDNSTSSNQGHASNMHSRTQRSQTLSRKHVKRSHSVPAALPKTGESKLATGRSPMISKYAPHPKPEISRRESDLRPVQAHPITVRVAAKGAQPKQSIRQAPVHHVTPKPVQRTHKPSDIIKAEATAKALAEAPSHHRAPHRDKKANRNNKQRFGRALSFASSGFALLLMAGYFTYINMPNLSVRVAAVQSGIDAGYPSHRPSGYSLSGPIAFNDGEVRMAFAANGTNRGFTLTQAKSSWDSSALLNDYVTPKAGSDYLTTAGNGLTIYSWGGNAAWVSGGILHTIEGDAPLSPDQIQRIATSL